MSGIDRTSSAKQTRASKDATSTHNASKNPKSTPAKVPATGYRLRSTPESSSPALKERLRDASPDSSKSSKTPIKKRSTLKINKITKLKSSPYATRSLSPLVSVLRNGKRKREALNMIPKFKKRVLGDREETKLLVEGIKKEIESDLTSPESLLKQSRKRNVPVEKSSIEPSKRCKISRDDESCLALKRVKRRVGKLIADDEVKDENQSEVSEPTESLSDRTSVRKKCDDSPTPKKSGNVCDISLDKTSASDTLGESFGSALESENTCGSEDLISKPGCDHSCGTTFDLSKCENCLQPVIVDTKESLCSDVKSVDHASDTSLPEMLYLSDSQSSFEKVNESFSHGTEHPKADLEVGKCELDDCSDILSIDNSSSSLMVCSSTSQNMHSGVSLPPYGPEDESVSVNATCDSLSMLDAEESMNEFMHEISSSKGRENSLDFADSSNDSNRIDATSIIKTLEQTEPLSDEMDSLCKDPGLAASYGVTSKAEASGGLEGVQNVSIGNVVSAIGSSIHHHDMNENLKESDIDLSVYGGVGLSEHHGSYSFDPVDHLQDFSAGIDSCERLAESGIEGSAVFSPNHRPPEPYSMHISESLAAQEARMVSESNEPTHNLNDNMPIAVSESLKTITALGTKAVSSNHEGRDECNIFPEDESPPPRAAEENGSITRESSGLHPVGGGSSAPLAEMSSLEKHGPPVLIVESTLESPCLQLANESDNLERTTQGESIMCDSHEGTRDFVPENVEGYNIPSEDLSSNGDEKANKVSCAPSMKSDGELPGEKSYMCQSEEDHSILLVASVSNVNHTVLDNTVLVSDSPKPMVSTAAVSDVNHTVLENSVMVSDSPKLMVPTPTVSDVNLTVLDNTVLLSDSRKSIVSTPTVSGVDHTVLENSVTVSDSPEPMLPTPSVSDVNNSVLENSVMVSDSHKPMVSAPTVSDGDHTVLENSVVVSDTSKPIDFCSAHGDSPDSVTAVTDAVDVSVVDTSTVDMSDVDTCSDEPCADDLNAADVNAVSTSSVGVSTVDTSTWNISAIGTSAVVSDNVDSGDVDNNDLNAIAAVGPILANKSAVMETDMSNELSSEANESDTVESKCNVVTSLNDYEASLVIDDKCENMKDVVNQEKTVGNIETIDSFSCEKSEVFEDVGEEHSGKGEGRDPGALSSAVVEMPCVDGKDAAEREPTSSKSYESVSKPEISVEEDSAEQLAIKETILNALGLQSSRAASMAKSSARQELPPIPSRTSGTLKTIIKVPKMVDKKRTRNPLRLSLDIHKTAQEKEKDLLNARRGATERADLSGSLSADQASVQDPYTFRIFNEAGISPGDTWEAHISKHRSKSHGNSRKFPSGDIPHLDHLPFSRTSINGMSSSSSLDWQSKACQDLDQNVPSDGSSNSGRSSQPGSSEGSGASGEPSLVIPEKSASFSIHPERLCHDVCCYCFGKFGSLDTPMHLAQMKGEEKRRTALALEANLQQDSCLCDACYRYLDRKASCPSYQPYQGRRQGGVSGGILTKPQVCCVRGCSLPAHHLVRRKWLTRLRRTISKLLPIELTPVPSHQQQPLHAPLCSRHFYCLEYYSLCGICKRKLSRNNMHPVGREVHALNSVLMEDAIPVTLTGKIFLCKMCRYYSGIRLKYRDKSMLSSGHRTFFDGYRKRIWHYLGIQTLDSSEISEPMEIPKKKKKSRLCEGESSKTCDVEKTSVNEGSALSQSAEIISSESGSEVSCGKPGGGGPMPTKIRLKLGNVSIGQLSNVGQMKESKEQTLASGSHRGKSDPSKPKKKSSVGSEMKTPCFPGTEHLGLNASFVFHGNSGGEKNKEWEKCTTTIQFDSKTKKLWQNLYYPYGNFSSFIRHLVIMEKNWRNGDLILAPNASPQAVNYVNSVQNRIAAYEGGSSRSDSARPSTSSSGKHVSSRPPPTAACASLSSASPRLSASLSSSSSMATSSPSSSVPVVDLAQEPVQLVHLPPLVISSKSTALPPKTTKDTRFLPSPTVVPRLNLASPQIAPRVQTIAAAPLAAQFIPVSAAAANFLPITCGGSNQFISFGSTSSFIQLGGPSGLVHSVGGSSYPYVQFPQQVLTEKVAVDKGGRAVGGGQGYLSGKNPSSSLSELELHISNVRSLANDAGSNNAWDPQLEKAVMVDENTYTSDSATQSSGRSEEHSLEVGSVGSGASTSLEASDNHSDEAVGNSGGGREGQGDIFGIV